MAARHLVLVGMMGAGKSTVGRIVSVRLGWPFVDLDSLFETRVGCTVSAFFSSHGEAEFRGREADLLAEILDRCEPHVVATGGGAVLSDRAKAMMQTQLVLWLDAEPNELAARLRGDLARPLLAGGDPQEILATLQQERRAHYSAVATCRYDVTDRTAEQAAEFAAAQTGARPKERFTHHVTHSRGQYPIVVGAGVVTELADVLPAGTRKVAVVRQAGVGEGVEPNIEHRVFEIGDGEPAKSMDSVMDLCRGFAQWGMSRADAVVTVGGGVVTDTAGFAASVYHRGIPVLHVPTTLLGQVDAAIGGKTGINLPEGKNLVGTFWQPCAVLCDTDLLLTLPAREFRSGMGELAKYHFLGGGELDSLRLPERVSRAIAIKAEVVSADEREDGRRAILNYGHTLAHALEIAGAYDLRHGEAVGIGLVFAAELAHHLGRITSARVAEHRRVVATYGLRHDLPGGADPAQLIALMARDKKATHGLTFVLDGADNADGVEVVRDVQATDLYAAFAAMNAAYELTS